MSHAKYDDRMRDDKMQTKNDTQWNTVGNAVGALATDAANRSARRRRGDSTSVSALALALAGGDEERAAVVESVILLAVAAALVPLATVLVRASTEEAEVAAVAIAGALLRFSFCESTMARTLRTRACDSFHNTKQRIMIV